MTPDRRDSSRYLADGRYEVLAKLGEGGMGIVWKARDRNLDTDVVVKMPRRALLDDPEFAGRFTREVRSLVKLTHPRIVKITDVGENDNVPFAVMQYLPGGSLQTRRKESGGRHTPMPPGSLARWLPAIAEALDFVHQKGYLHRDVKPSNILFDEDGNAYLSDFGLVKALSASDARTRETGSGLVVGTPEYVAPEVIMGTACDGRADQYGLAATVYDVLSGRVPFSGPTPAAILVMHTTVPLTPLTQANPALPPGLAAVVERGLTKDPNGRYRDCSSFARAVIGALPEEGATTEGAASFSVPLDADAEPLSVLCPGCRKTFKVPPRLMTGPKIRCPSCETAFAPVFGAKTMLGAQPRPTGAAPRPESPPVSTRRTEAVRPPSTPRPTATARVPQNRLPPWVSWGIASAAAALFAVLALVLFIAWLPRSPTVVYLPYRETAAASTAASEPKETKPETPATSAAPKETKPEPKDTKPAGPNPGAVKERIEIGRAVVVSKPYPNLLLARQKGKDDWQRVMPDKPVYSSDTLVALPGYRAGIQHSSGVELFLWGNLPEVLPMVPLLESAVTINNKPDVDLDLTLSSGRVALSNTKEAGPLKARITFNEEAGKPAESWEVTLEPGAEVVMDLIARYDRETAFNSGEGPLSLLYFVILKGQVKLKIDRQTLSPPADGASYLEWANKGPGVRGPLPIDPNKMQPWDKRFAETPQANEARRALEELLRPGSQTIEVLLEESLTSDRPPTRTLAVYCLGALNNLSKLLDVLADQEERHSSMRDAAILSLRHWIGHRLENDKKLYDLLLQVKKFKERDANTTMALLHDFPDDQLKQPETWAFLISCIRDKKPIIRELAYWHLSRLVSSVRGKPQYYPGGGDSEKPERAFAEWKKLVPDGQLPKPPGTDSQPPK